MDFDWFMRMKDSVLGIHPQLLEFINTYEPKQPHSKPYKKAKNNNNRLHNNNHDKNHDKNHGRNQNKYQNNNGKNHQSDNNDDFTIKRNNKFKPLEDGIQSKIRGTLNKLSKNNGDAIITELLNLNIDKESDIEILVDIIFLKAYTETIYSNLYARMCRTLKKKYDDKIEEIMDKKYKVLFDECMEFETEKPNTFKTKADATAFIGFIGESYNEDVMDKDSVVCILDDLLDNDTKCTFRIDYVCSLLGTCGKKLSAEGYEDIKEYIDDLDKLKDSESIDIREKFALIELMDVFDRCD